MEIGQLLKHSPYKPEDCNLVPRTPVKRKMLWCVLAIPGTLCMTLYPKQVSSETVGDPVSETRCTVLEALESKLPSGLQMRLSTQT